MNKYSEILNSVVVLSGRPVAAFLELHERGKKDGFSCSDSSLRSLIDRTDSESKMALCVCRQDQVSIHSNAYVNTPPSISNT